MHRPGVLVAWLLYYSLAHAIIESCALLQRATRVQTNRTSRMNVVWMIADDLDAKLNHLGHPEVYTPNLDALAKDGVSFPLAYTDNPICAPSRTSFLYGMRSTSSGNTWFRPYWHNDVFLHSASVMEHFKNNGYQTFGTGKIFHGYGSAEDPPQSILDEMFSDNPTIKKVPDYGPWPVVNGTMKAHPHVEKPWRHGMDSFGSLADIPEELGMTGWRYTNTNEFRYNSENDRDKMPDELTVDWGISKIKEFGSQPASERKPFFLQLGFIKPHTPLHVPEKFFQIVGKSYELAQQMVTTGTRWRTTEEPEDSNYDTLVESYGSKEVALGKFFQAYLAGKAFVDHCVGQVLSAIKESNQWDNTIVVVNADHGFHIGQKEWLGKNTPYEEATHVPLIIRAPGVSQSGGRPTRAVSLIDIYPTLIDLCGISSETVKSSAGHKLDGLSLKPLLVDPDGQWQGPEGAVSVVMQEFTGYEDRQPILSLRTKSARYIRYFDGREELYDHRDGDLETKDLSNSTTDLSKEKLFNTLQEITGMSLEPNKPWW